VSHSTAVGMSVKHCTASSPGRAKKQITGLLHILSRYDTAPQGPSPHCLPPDAEHQKPQRKLCWKPIVVALPTVCPDSYHLPEIKPYPHGMAKQVFYP